MRSIAILNQKGGSGKTTTAVNLAAALGEIGKRTLLVDMDAQATATDWLGISNPGRGGITDIFIHQRPLLELVQATEVPGVALVPASPRLVGAEKALEWELNSVQIFRRSVDALPPDQWDYLIVDCPPAWGLITANTLVGVKEVLIPVEAHYLSLASVERVLTATETLRRHLNPELRILGIVACRVDLRTRHAKAVVKELRSRFGQLVFKEEVRENIRLAEAPASRVPITVYDPQSRGAKDYRRLAAAMIERGAAGHPSSVVRPAPTVSTPP